MNLRTQILLLLFLFNPAVIFCKETKYKVSDIPGQLKENAKAIVRYESIDFEVFSNTKAIQKSKFAITILNKNGFRNSIFIGFYDKFSKISNIRATIFDKDGAVVKRIKPDEIFDYSAISGFSLYEDSRVKLIVPKYETYPFTVEYSFEMQYSGYLNFPRWNPVKDFNISVQESFFRVTVPNDYNFRYLERNLNDVCQKAADGLKLTYSWNVKNLVSVLKEEYSQSSEEYLPTVYAAPSDIEFAGFKGNFETWQNFGKWILSLNKGRDEVDTATSKYILNLVKDSINEIDKIRVLYEYMQNKTRYVSIQIGIGGWQPMDAKIVDKYSYGDCKALSNYMKSLLKVAGIQSNYTLIKAGRDEPGCITEFPSNQFNHAILCVPVTNDTIWLECTSQHIPFGYLGTFTDDREALMITDSGGVMVHTPVLSIEDNYKQTNATVRIDSNGIIYHADLSIKYSGSFYDEMQRFLMSDASHQKQFIEQNIIIPGSVIKKYNLNENKSRKPFLRFDLSMGMEKDFSINDHRIIVPVNLLIEKNDIPVMSSERKSDIFIKRSYQLIDTITFLIPEDYRIEQIPQEESVNSSFGNYSCRLIQTDHVLYYIRKLEMYKGQYPTHEYEKLTAFFGDIEKFDNVKFILGKKE